MHSISHALGTQAGKKISCGAIRAFNAVYSVKSHVLDAILGGAHALGQVFLRGKEDSAEVWRRENVLITR